MYILIIFTHLLFANSVEFKSTIETVEIQSRNEEGRMATVFKTKDPATIIELKSCLKGKPAPNFKCGYTGKIIFYDSNGEKWSASFNLSSCNHIVYMKGSRLVSKYLKDESIQLLKKLSKL